MWNELAATDRDVREGHQLGYLGAQNQKAKCSSAASHKYHPQFFSFVSVSEKRTALPVPTSEWYYEYESCKCLAGTLKMKRTS